MIPNVWYLGLSFFFTATGRVARRCGLAGTRSAPWGASGDTAAACPLTAGTGADVLGASDDDACDGAALATGALLADGDDAVLDAGVDWYADDDESDDESGDDAAVTDRAVWSGLARLIWNVGWLPVVSLAGTMATLSNPPDTRDDVVNVTLVPSAATVP